MVSQLSALFALFLQCLILLLAGVDLTSQAIDKCLRVWTVLVQSIMSLFSESGHQKQQT